MLEQYGLTPGSRVMVSGKPGKFVLTVAETPNQSRIEIPGAGTFWKASLSLTKESGMMFLRSALVLVVLILATADPLRGDECDDKAAPPSTKGLPVLDARTGQFAGPTSFGRKDTTQLMVINKNPFRFDYELQIDQHEVPEPAIGAFLTLAGISQESAPAEADVATPIAATPPPGSSAPAAAAQNCPAAMITTLDNRHQDLDSKRQRLERDITAAVNAYEKVQAAVERLQASLLSTTATGPELCKLAKQVIAKAAEFKPDVQGLNASHNELQKLATTQEDALDALTCKAPTMAEYRKRVRFMTGEFAKFAEKKIQEIEAAQTKLAEESKNVQNTLNKTDAFWSSHPLGPFRNRTDADVNIKRKDTTVDGSTLTDLRDEPVTLNFGGKQQFFLGGGIASSVANRRRYAAIDGFVLDRDGKFVLDENGKPKIGKVVGVEEESDGRVAPAVLLHGIIWRPKRGLDGIGLALGVGSSGGDETLIEYFVGPTFSFVDDHLFITLGAFRGVEEELAGDFYDGAEIPSTVTDLPLTERRTWHYGVSLTFRMP